MIEKIRGIGLVLMSSDVHKLAAQVKEATDSATASQDSDRILELLRLLCLGTLGIMAMLLWAVLRRLNLRLSPLYQSVRSQ